MTCRGRGGSEVDFLSVQWCERYPRIPGIKASGKGVGCRQRIRYDQNGSDTSVWDPGSLPV